MSTPKDKNNDDNNDKNRDNDNPPITIKIKPKIPKRKLVLVEDKDLKTEYDTNNCGAPENAYDKTCNKFLLKKELVERKQLIDSDTGGEQDYLYQNLNDANFIVKIAEKKEFNDSKYDGEIQSYI